MGLLGIFPGYTSPPSKKKKKNNNNNHNAQQNGNQQGIVGNYIENGVLQELPMLHMQ